MCAGALAGKYFPGAEVPGRYALNPGEGFAEAYRVLNEQGLGLTPLAWGLVSYAFFPDAGALAAVAQDVTEPWSGVSTSTTSGRLSRRAPARFSPGAAADTATTDWPTPLDGPVSVTLTTSKRLRARMGVYSGTDLLATTTAAGRPMTASATVCGTRTLSTRVTRLAGAGRFTVSLSSP